MKALLLSCTTGEGHNSAAYALYEALEALDVKCEFTDALQFAGEKVSTIVTASYSSIILYAPAIFGLAYKVGDLYSSSKLPSPIYWTNAVYTKTLYEYIQDHNFDIVISTHLFPMEALTYIRRKYSLAAKCYSVLTDYTCVPFFDEVDADGYFLPHQDVLSECLNNGMPANRLCVTGLPVAKRFTEHIPKEGARNYLVIPQDAEMYLIMLGGIGCGNVLSLCDELLKNRNDAIIIYILAGRNSELMNKANDKYQSDHRVQAVAFTEKVNIYMCAADVVISKPGGISSTEAAALNVPLVHAMAIPGCEIKNAQLFSRYGMSLYAHNEKEAARLASDPAAAAQMRQAQKAGIPSSSASKIARLICNRQFHTVSNA